MANITDLVLYLSTGRCIAWIGSGPSIEAGLPSWRMLANRVLESCRRDRRRGFETIETLYRERKYPEMFDEVERHYTRQYLIDNCFHELQDTGNNTAVYQSLARINFLAYFTTNYDDILLRHIEEAGTAIGKYTNSPDDLSAVDLDLIPTLVKLHGDFSQPHNLVLTRSDYRRQYRSGSGAAYQSFLKGYLSRDRLLFIGYSMSDPEVLQIQEEIQSDLRRSVKSIAVLANVPGHDIRRWNLDYNIDILPYSAVDSDHSELTAILESVERILSSGQISANIDSEQELKRAEALFLWYRFLPGQNESASIDALQSVILHILSERADGVDLATIKERLGSDLGFKDPSRSDELENCLDRLVATDWIIESEGIYQMESETLRIVTIFERRFTDMMNAFERQITLDAVRVFSVDENKGPEFAKLFLNTLIDIFQSRGREILRVVFDQSPISSSGALELIEIIWKHGQRLLDPRDRPTFVRLVLTAMFEPKGIYDTVLNYFAKAFFCIQALGANKTVNEIVTDVIADRALLIDANILIPLTAQHEDRHEFVAAVIESCRTAGIRLYATEAALEEVRRHASWASHLVDEFGSLSPEVLYAAMGEGGYESNAFLK